MSKQKILELNEMSDKLCQKMDEDWQEVAKFNGSWKNLQKKIEEKIKEYDKEKDEIHDFWIQHVRSEFDISKLMQIINLHKNKWISLSLQVHHIKKKDCYQCKSKFSLSNIWVASYTKRGELKGWSIDKVEQFGSLSKDWEIRESTPLFCSDACFQESSFSDEPKKPNQEQSSKQENSPSQSQETNAWCCDNLYCPAGFQERTGSYCYNPKRNDGLKFCSDECYLAEYGKKCHLCKNKFLNFKKDDNGLIYCVPCWKNYWDKKANELEKEIEEGKSNLQKNDTKLERLEKERQKNNEIIDQLTNNHKNNEINHKTSLITQKDKDINSNLNMNIERERERERESKIKANLIKDFILA